MLRLEGLSKHFGGLRVLERVDLEVPDSGIFGLIGPNGAGKTTVFNLITGLLRPTSGAIHYGKHDLLRLPPHRINQAGIARTFQNIRLFPELTALDNVVVGMHAHLRYQFPALLLNLPRFRKAEAQAREQAREYLSWVGMDAKADLPAEGLSYGEQRRLELARALATRPKMLLLDEPVAGMNPVETAQLMEQIRAIAGRGYGVLLIEHDMRFVMGLCSRIAVLNFGSLIAQGSPEEIRNDPRVIEAYLGAEVAHG